MAQWISLIFSLVALVRKQEQELTTGDTGKEGKYKLAPQAVTLLPQMFCLVSPCAQCSPWFVCYGHSPAVLFACKLSALQNLRQVETNRSDSSLTPRNMQEKFEGNAV